MHADNATFKRVIIDCIISGGTRISWEMNSHFNDAGPYSFQLQFGRTGLDDADDWVNVGSPVVDTYFTFDTDKRVWGKTLDPHYRVELTTPAGTYYSEPESCDGHLSKRDWLHGREIIRKELLRHRVLTSPEGFLFKARRYGPRCPECIDEFTEEVTRSNCPTCYGTGFELGYFTPLPACFADIGLEQTREHRDANKGMDKAEVIEARFIGDTQLYSYDVWANKTSGERYYLHSIAVAAHTRGVPIVYTAELRLAPFSDVIYTVPIEEISFDKKAGQPCPVPLRNTRALNYLEVALAELRGRQKRRKVRSSRR